MDKPEYTTNIKCPTCDDIDTVALSQWDESEGVSDAIVWCSRGHVNRIARTGAVTFLTDMQ